MPDMGNVLADLVIVDRILMIFGPNGCCPRLLLRKKNKKYGVYNGVKHADPAFSVYRCAIQYRCKSDTIFTCVVTLRINMPCMQTGSVLAKVCASEAGIPSPIFF